MALTAYSPASSDVEPRVPSRRLVPWPPAAEPSAAFGLRPNGGPDGHPAIVTKQKQALLDDLRKLILQGVEPRPDGLECSPTEHSLAVAEQLVLSLPDDLELPSASLPDDGEITLSWQALDNQGERWRAVLAIAPDSEVECFVRRRTDHRPAARYRTKAEAGPLTLPDHIVNALRSHWRAA